MALVSADAESIDQFANTVNQLIEAGLAVLECLAASGDHGTRQGLAVEGAINEFRALLGPEITGALGDVVEHARSTAAIAGVVRETESEMTASIASHVGKAQAALSATGSGIH